MKKITGALRRLIGLIPTYARIPLFLCLITDLIAFYLPRLMGVQAKYDFSIALDAHFPPVPLFTIVYFSAFVFWTVNYILICRQSKELAQRLFFADTFSKIVCLVCFFALPCYIVQPANDQITGTGAWLLKLLYAVDEPNNLFPSIHCLVSWLSFRPLLSRDARRVPAAYKAFSGVFCVLICLSTLYTRQHVILDWAAGFAVAEIGWQLFGAIKRVRA